MTMNREQVFYERVVLVLLLVGTAVFYSVAMQSPSTAEGGDLGSMDFPKYILILLGIFSVLQLVMNLRNAKKAAPVDTLIPDKRIIFSIAAILAYAALWDIIGFCASTGLFLILEAKILKRDVDTRTTVLIALAGTAVVYLVFGVAFHVYLPEPLLEYVM